MSASAGSMSHLSAQYRGYKREGTYKRGRIESFSDLYCACLLVNVLDWDRCEAESRIERNVGVGHAQEDEAEV
jgi:hypothetical protein